MKFCKIKKYCKLINFLAQWGKKKIEAQLFILFQTLAH